MLDLQLIIARVLDDSLHPGTAALDTASAILEALADAGCVVDLQDVIDASLQ